MSRSLRAPRLALVLLIATCCAAASARAADPKENIPLGSPPASCSNEASAECERWVITRLDAAHADLGLSPYALPSSFVGLSADRQLLILADLDRGAYGYPTIYGLNSNLSEAARAGVRQKDDPTPPGAGGPWYGFGSDWASTGALIGYYLWMYDDGYGGPNGDCTSPGASGCWGHRHVILGEGLDLPEPVLLGAATGESSGESGSALIVSSDKGTSAYYTWAQAQKEGAGAGEEKHEEPPVSVRVTISGSGSVSVNGTTCAASCTQSVPSGSTVTLVARRHTGYRFAGWSGACSGTRVRCLLSAQGPSLSATATFVKKT